MTVLTTTYENFCENTILVHAGFNAVGQAAISIALATDYIVYTTVENEEQSKLLRKRFPLVRFERFMNILTILIILI